MQSVHLRKYGVETKINFELYEVDGVDLRIDAADAGTDCTIRKDQGADATCENDFADEGLGYSLTLTATEMEAASITVYIVDSATKVWLDKVICIETYGHASAQHAFDLDDAVRGGMTALPNAAADAAGGLPISDAGGLDLDTILAILTNSVAGDVWHVAKTGDNANSGHSYGDAKLYIATDTGGNSAVTSAVSGDTVVIHRGDYDETVNLNTTNKSLTLIGTNRYKSCIKNNGAAAGIVLETGTTLKNLSVYKTYDTTGAIGVYGSEKENCFIEDCNIYGDKWGMDVIRCGLIVRNSHINGTLSAAVMDYGKGTVFDNCTFKAETPFVTTGVLKVVQGHGAILNNCTIIGIRDDDTDKTATGVFTSYAGHPLILNNCSIRVTAGEDNTGDVCGCVIDEGEVLLNACNIETSTTGTGDVYDLKNVAGTLVITNSYYDTTKTSGTITQDGSGWAAAVNAEADTALEDINLDHLIQVASTINDASATTTDFDTALTEASNDHYNNLTIVFTDGALVGQTRRITDYVGASKNITVYPAFTEAPGNGDAFVILPYYYRVPGAGAIEVTYTMYTDEDAETGPIEGVEIFITTDSAGANPIWAGTTDALGVLRESGGSKPWLDAGTYYFFRKKSQYTFINPDTEVVA